MIYIILNLLFTVLAGAEDTNSVSSEALYDAATYTAEPSPYIACRGPRQVLTGQTRTGILTRHSPGTDRAGTRTVDFLKLVGKRIEEYGQSNIDMAEQMEKCFSAEWMRLDSFAQSYECRTTLHWVNPKQFAPTEGREPTDFSNSLFYAIDQARFNLALGSARVDPRDRFGINTNLRPHGYKSVAWDKLSPDEITRAESFMKRKYKDPITALMVKKRDSIEPYTQMFDSEFQEIENDEANRVRRHHLEVYQGIVGEYPIINYITSREPKATELAFAAKELKRNATNELAEIKQLVQELETKKDDFIDTKFNRLTEYRLLVEEVLLENPQYCAVASSAYGTQARRDTQHTVMAMAPILAASFFAPPLAAMGVALGGTSALAVRSINEREAAIQAAYGTAINDGYSSKKQADVDKAQRQMLTDVALVPTSALGFGVFAKGRQMYLQSLKGAK